MRIEDVRLSGTLICSDAIEALQEFDDDSVDVVVTSPPYFNKRKYHGIGDKQLGDEKTPQEYIEHIAEYLMAVKRVLKPTGSLWWNIGDTLKKTWQLIPERTVLKMRELGFFIRNKIIWIKKTAMPTPAKNRLRDGWEYFIHATLSPNKYYFDLERIRAPLTEGAIKRYRSAVRNNDHLPRKSKWGDWREAEREAKIHESIDHMRINLKGANPPNYFTFAVSNNFKDAHPALFPLELPLFAILASAPPNGLIVDPFGGAGTTALAVEYLNRRLYRRFRVLPNDDAQAVDWHMRWVSIDISEVYTKLAYRRLLRELGLTGLTVLRPTVKKKEERVTIDRFLTE